LAYALHEIMGLIRVKPRQIHPDMKKIFLVISLLTVFVTVNGQTIAKVDKKTKEFYIPANSKVQFRIFGYEFPNVSTRKMICFSSYTGDVGANMYNCPLGSYFDTGIMREGDKIIYLGPAGSFSKMNYITGAGKKTIFYFPKGTFLLK
jgi:hypothetical protein